MGPVFQRIEALFEDLRRRKVLRAGGLYWIGSLAFLGGLDLLRDLLPWLDRAFPALVLTAILLFPAVLLVAWAFDWDADGLQIYRPASGGPGPGGVASVLLVLALASGGFGWAVLQLWAASNGGDGDVASAPGAPDPTRVAVLYFDDDSPDGELDYLARGLTEGLINALGNVGTLTVTSRNGVRPFRDAALPSDSIARRLGVGTLVTGSVTGGDDRVRVFAQLVDVTRGDEQLWSGRFEHDPSDVLTLQSELVEEISAGLRQNLGIAVRAREAALETESDEAWLRFQEARQLIDRAAAGDGSGREFSLALLERADSLLSVALRHDPMWGAPLVTKGWLAHDRSMLESEMAGFVRAQDSIPLLRRADQAVARTGGAPEALELRGVLQLELAEATSGGEAWRARAEEDLLAAVRADPRRALALAHLAGIRRISGDFVEARTYAQRAMEADAFLERADDVVYELYNMNVELKAWEEADRWCREGRRRFERSLRFVFCRLQFEALRPDVARPEVAWALLDTLRTGSTVEDWEFQYRTWGGFQVATVLARQGMRDSAEAVVDAYAPAPEDRPWFAYDEAHVLLLLGDREGALDLLELYLGVAPDRRGYLPSDWLFEELWSHPRFLRMTLGDGS